MDEDLLATCAGLGYTEANKYFRGEECWECTKDLISFLKLDDESTCTYRLQMGGAHLLQKDLLSILVNFHEDERLMDVIIRLLLNLTQPAQTCMNKHPTVKKSDLMDMGVYMALNSTLRKYKEAFTVEAVFQVLGGILGTFCQKEYDKRTDDDIHLVERILGIIRNVLHVPADPAEEKRTSDDVSVHDQIIWSLHTNGFFELFIYIASSSEEQDWLLYIAEIMFLMMREQNPSSLASALRGTRAVEEKQEDNRELALLLERERAMKAKKAATYSSRHSRFLGTYTCTDIQGVGDRMLIYHKPLHDANQISFDKEKRGRKKSRHRKPAESEDLKRTSTLSIRKVLANFCVDFLKSCYNLTMQNIRRRLVAGRCQSNDETYYLWCMRFFMEFSRIHEFNTDIVSETMTMDAFNFVMKQVFSTYESVQLEKQQAARPWSKRLQYAVSAYHELLQYVQVLSLSENEEARDNAKIMQRNIFYIPEYRDIFVSLLKTYDEVKADKNFLSDVAETVHLYIKLIERYCKERGGRIMVQARKKATKGRGKKSGGGGGAAAAPGDYRRGPWALSEEQMQELWEEHAEGATAAFASLSGDDDSDAIPFDAASEMPDDVQRSSTAQLIRSHLLSSAYRRACQLFRASRDIWKDGTFGSADSTIEDEIVCMRQIFFNLIMPDLAPEEDDEAPPEGSTQNGSMEDGDGPSREFIGAAADDDDEEGGGGSVAYDFEFNLQTYIAKFANFRVVRNYGLLLERYATNSVQLNHCIVKMMYRIAHDCQLMPLFFQLSLFAVFDKILNDPAARNKQMTELYKFSAYVVRAFTAQAVESPILYVEALFWKDGPACFEIQNGYGTAKTSKDRILAQKIWTDEQKEQLAELYERFKGAGDMVGDIMVELEGEPARTRRQVCNQLVKQGLVENRKELHRKFPNPDGKQKQSKWSDNDLVGSGDSSSSDDENVDTVLARLQNQAANVDLEEDDDQVSDLPVRQHSEPGTDMNASIVEGLVEDGDSDDDASAPPAPRPRRKPLARPKQRNRRAASDDGDESELPSDVDDSSGDDDAGNTALRIDTNAGRQSSSDDDNSNAVTGSRTRGQSSDENEDDKAESLTPSFATSRHSRALVDDSDEDEEDDAGTSSRQSQSQSPKRTVRGRIARFASDSESDEDIGSSAGTQNGGGESNTPAFAARQRPRTIGVSSDEDDSNDGHDANGGSGDGGESHTPAFAAMSGDHSVDSMQSEANGSTGGESHTPSFASRHHARIADDSNDDDDDDDSNGGSGDGGESHTPAFAAMNGDRGVDTTQSEANGSAGGESHTPSFASRHHARIADDSGDDNDDVGMGVDSSHSPPASTRGSLRAAVPTKRARLIDSSDEEDVMNTEATPSFAKRVCEE